MSRFRSITILILIISITLITSIAFAQEPPPNLPLDPLAIPFGGRETKPNLETIKGTIPDWTMLAYQQQEAENWDIYATYKSLPHRLTFNSANDEQPSLDRGTRRVAFVSNRGGDYDLYVIKANGKDLYKVFDTPATVGFPAWSPDGTRIAVQVQIDGQYEIYLVNPDGSNLNRLTNHSAFDGMPAWHPDGSKLAFVSNRSGDYRILTMNADGTNPQPLSTFPRSFHPDWSPDGDEIAFDADTDDDGFQELARINADGSGQTMLYNPGDMKTAWSGSWAPDKSAIGFDEISVEKQNGNWVWTKALIRQWDTNNGAQNLLNSDKNWYMDWQTRDDIPPESAYEPMAQYTRAEGFRLKYGANDQGGSGVRAYSTYYDNGDGSGWHTYWGNTTVTNAPFPAEPGTTVKFQVRAFDNAFNQEAWKKTNIVKTTFYASEIGGTVNDNRGSVLDRVTVSTAPKLPNAPLITDYFGQYNGYIFDDIDHILSINEPNYLPLANTVINAGDDYIRDLYLMPSDNQVYNGTFEINPGTHINWSSAGNLPKKDTNEYAATGRWAFQLGPDPSGVSTSSVNNTGFASIAQKVTIPANLQGPTLSFMVRKAGDPPSNGSGLHVFIKTDSQKIPAVIDEIKGRDWQQQWIDMTPYKGQEVRIIFELIQEAGDPPQTFTLDDVSLGSSHPDLWVYLVVNKGSVFPGDVARMTIYSMNRGGYEAKNAYVQVKLPPELFLVSATPPYTLQNNFVRWNLGDLPPGKQTIRRELEVSPVTFDKPLIHLQAKISSAADEAHLTNNSSWGTIRVLKDLYIPLLYK